MIKQILIKKPFGRIVPDYALTPQLIRSLDVRPAEKMSNVYTLVTQGDFLREYYPSGHKINDPNYYHDRIKYDEEKKEFFTEKVHRASFPLQQIITIQQLVHLCGNETFHELTDETVDDTTQSLFLNFKKGWFDKNIDIRIFDFLHAVKTTGDGAIVFYLSKSKLYTKVLSYHNGDQLFPHYDSMTGELSLFARRYSDYDEKGENIINWVEVWDDKYFYRYRQDLTGLKGAINKIKEYFGLDGYVLNEAPTEHGFSEVPVVYHRDEEGPCWTPVQDSIDKYELAISYLCQNNMAYAFPIMVLKSAGDSAVNIQGDIYGQVKAITMGAEDSADYLSSPQGSESFRLQLDTLLKMIFMGSFIVTPPEIRSGDLPGVAIKLIYSPSIEKAIVDAKRYDHSIDKIKRLFQFGYGVETDAVSRMTSLNIASWIEPYVHQNTAELIQNLATSVQNGFLSKQTGSEQTPYSRNNEWERIMKEYKEQQQADLLFQMNPDGNNTTTENNEE